MSTFVVRKISAAAVTAALAVAGLSVAQAGTVPYGTGFNLLPGPNDNPAVPYAPGNLVNQNNWTDAAPGTGSLSVVTSVGVPGATAANGTQVVKSVAQNQYAKGANNTVYSDVYSTDTVYSRATILAPVASGGFGGVVDISYDLNRVGGANRASGFGVEVFGDSQNSIIASLFLGNNSSDSTPILLTENPQTQSPPNINAGFGRADGGFNTYHIELNYLNNTYSVSVGSDNPVTYSDPNLGSSGIGGIAFANTNDGADTAFYDNLRVVPEPAAISMVGLGTLLLLTKRRKRLA